MSSRKERNKNSRSSHESLHSKFGFLSVLSAFVQIHILHFHSSNFFMESIFVDSDEIPVYAMVFQGMRVRKYMENILTIFL